MVCSIILLLVSKYYVGIIIVGIMHCDLCREYLTNIHCWKSADLIIISKT